jgi:hypothetical protein
MRDLGEDIYCYKQRTMNPLVANEGEKDSSVERGMKSDYKALRLSGALFLG